jgi:thiosulfate reductase cytochrome b subunit
MARSAPLFPFAFPPSLTLGGWLAGGLLWHFAGMWLFVANGLVYLVLGTSKAHFDALFGMDLRSDTRGSIAMASTDSNPNGIGWAH